MLKPKKKISRKEIKQDGLITAYAKTSSFYYQYKKQISYGLTALLIIFIIIIIYNNNRRANNERASNEFSKVMYLYDAGSSDVKQYNAAINGLPEKGIIGLKAIVDNYGGTDAGELAKFYLANANYQLGKYDEALKYFNDFSSDNELLQASAFAGSGGCYEAKGDYSDAASYFERAANTISNPLNTPDYLNSAARCYGLVGKKDKAISLYKRLKKEFPTSNLAREADRFIAQFSA